MTTGPLGQGLATAVGMALAGKMAAARFNTDDFSLLDYDVVTLAGDGCLMEGISSEAASFAAHYGLDNLTVLYDSNDICLDGPIDECFSEDVIRRFESYGFIVREIDGHSLTELQEALEFSRERSGKPKLIVCKTTIGKGSPNKQGTSSCHGSPLGDEEIRLVKEGIGLPLNETFHILPGVGEYFAARQKLQAQTRADWQQEFEAWSQKYPEKRQLWDAMRNPDFSGLEDLLPVFETGSRAAGRKVSSQVLQELARKLPGFIGGSADLSCSDSTELKGLGFVTRNDFSGRNIKFGVREFAMGAICNGLSLSGFFQPYCGTFLCFSDYVRPAIRLAALSHISVSYQFTHDSIFLGEDGPTHQPVEHASALRAIPNLLVFRPADGNEARASWLAGLNHKGPKAYLLSRQNQTQLSQTKMSVADGVGRGAYIVHQEKDPKKLDYILFSSGAELELVLEVAGRIEALGNQVRVVSVPCFELFEAQEREYQDQILARHARHRFAVEAQVSHGWHRFLGLDGKAITVDRYGASAPEKEIREFFGFTADALYDRIMEIW